MSSKASNNLKTQSRSKSRLVSTRPSEPAVGGVFGRSKTVGSDGTRVKPRGASMGSKIRLVCLLLVLMGLGAYAWRQSLWRTDVKVIERLIEMRADRRAITAATKLNQKWGRTGEGHLLIARSLRHLDRDEAFNEEINRASVRGASKAIVDQEARLMLAQSGNVDLDGKQIEAILTDTNLPLDENAEAIMKGFIARDNTKKIVDLMQLWDRQEPSTHWTKYFQGAIAARSGDMQTAKKLLEESLEKRDNFLPTWLELGKTYWFLEEPDKAIELLERVAQVEPDNDEANSGLAESLLAVGRFDESEKVLRRFYDPKDVNSDSPRLLGKALLGAERFQEAIDVMLPASRAWPEDYDLNHQLSECYQQIGNDEKANQYSKEELKSLDIKQDISRLRARSRQEVDNPELLIKLGHELMQVVSREEGKRCLEQAISIDNTLIPAHVDLAKYYAYAGSTQRAEAHRRAVQQLTEAAKTKSP